MGLGFAAPLAVAAAATKAAQKAANAGGSASGGAGTESQRGVNKTDLTTCAPGEVGDPKKRKRLERHSGVLPDQT